MFIKGVKLSEVASMANYLYHSFAFKVNDFSVGKNDLLIEFILLIYQFDSDLEVFTNFIHSLEKFKNFEIPDKSESQEVKISRLKIVTPDFFMAISFCLDYQIYNHPRKNNLNELILWRGIDVPIKNVFSKNQIEQLQNLNETSVGEYQILGHQYSFVNCSLSRGTAEDFTEWLNFTHGQKQNLLDKIISHFRKPKLTEQKVLLKIHVSNKVNRLYIQQYYEQEFLLPKGVLFKLRKATLEHNYFILEVDAIETKVPNLKHNFQDLFKKKISGDNINLVVKEYKKLLLLNIKNAQESKYNWNHWGIEKSLDVKNVTVKLPSSLKKNLSLKKKRVASKRKTLKIR